MPVVLPSRDGPLRVEGDARSLLSSHRRNYHQDRLHGEAVGTVRWWALGFSLLSGCFPSWLFVLQVMW